MAYCEVTDLLNGAIPVLSTLDPQKFVNDAADEIDTYIGRLYETPVDLGAASRIAGLFLKRMNAHLATGRLILAQDSSGEEDQLHAYGLYLIKQCMDALEMVRCGDYNLDGAVKIDGTTLGVINSPLIANLDPISQVEGFYDLFNPNSPSYYADPRPFPYGIRGVG